MHESGCYGGVDAGSGPGTGESPCEWEPIGERTVVVGDDESLGVTHDRAVEHFGLILFLDYWWDDGLGNELTLFVEDPCGRIGEVVRTFR
jgi:hypothetical protein